MSQAISREILAISLTSMQPPQEAASNSLTLKDSKTDEPINNELLLRPGEVGQMLLRLVNVANRPLRWQLRIAGDFPYEWCEWNQPDFEEIAPNQKIEREIAFKVTEDFFENQLILNPENPLLQINYQSQIYIYIDEGREPQLIQYRIFNLLVRPSHTYLDFLPALYREVDFIGRFVSILEQAFDPAVQTLDTLWAYLDPITAPNALLPFLAHWVGWEMDSRWDIERQRHLIRNAIVLYRWHGTRYGLRLYLHLYTGLPLEQIQIREIFEQGFVLGSTHIGEDSMLGGGRPYHFIVEIYLEQSTEIDEELVRDIIERQKPAFCTYDLEIRNL
ncbi:phage tail protein [Anabaena catenula]|uniref:Phage tail protein n=1 Tax=Anabaena catenula FACHB-362 TaxID=2692877 RepID=A0ABR8J504_9NOST|nr:phage tail protein [Anabaena catenula]MBD2692111.1 phage tail protein [Anabaena catenula FACHB-362]